MEGPEILTSQRAFGGTQIVARHRSAACACAMTFGLFLPPAAESRTVPALWFLGGLTCTHENAMLKAGLQAHAARHQLALVFPDTSPRGAGVADDAADDLGQGASFYVDATEPPWSAHFRMETYVAEELPDLLAGHFPLDGRHGLTGHSMGGHGALVLALRHPERFASLSALAPICSPSRSAWGQRQFAAYLGGDDRIWAGHDAARLLTERGWTAPILVDQGSSDPFLDLLMPETLAEAAARRRQPAILRLQAGYDHSYFFVASVAADHVAFHAGQLTAA